MAKDVQLYHVTYNGLLPAIANEGLQVDAAGSAIGQGGGYKSYSQGKVFLTDASGIKYWMRKAYDWALDQSDDPVADGYVPVVLEAMVEHHRLRFDELGTNDARHDSFYVTTDIDPEDLAVWDGDEWEDDLSALEPDYFAEAGSSEDEDDEDSERRVLSDPDDSTLMPPEQEIHESGVDTDELGEDEDEEEDEDDQEE